MKTNENDALDAMLFGSDSEMIDLRCFRGERADVSEAEIRDQIHSAIIQKKMGRADISEKSPLSGITRKSVKELVSALELAD